jgi:hypothetical protein
MSTFYFHLQTGDERITDEIGSEHLDLRSATHEAAIRAADLATKLSSENGQRSAQLAWFVVLEDSSGNERLRVTVWATP